MIEPFDEEEYNEKVMKLKQIPLSKSKTIIELQKSAQNFYLNNASLGNSPEEHGLTMDYLEKYDPKVLRELDIKKIKFGNISLTEA